MDVGICLPYMERDLEREHLLEWCRAADQGPFSSLQCGERITGPTIEMATTLGAAAALTERVRIVPSLYVLPMHSSVRAAKQIATLDVISGGRVEVVVGVGGREVDYRALGAPFAHRHARMDEQVAEMKRVWAGESLLEGVDPVGPAPVQAGGPRVLAGAMGPKALARAARWADGVYAWSGGGEPGEIERAFASVRAAWKEAGREEEPRLVGGFWFSLSDDAAADLERYVFEYLAVFGEAAARAIAKTARRSNPEAIRESLAGYEAAGAHEAVLVPATHHPHEIHRVSNCL